MVRFDVIMKGLHKNNYSKSIDSEKYILIMISNGIYQAMFLQDGQHIKTEYYCLQQTCPSSML